MITENKYLSPQDSQNPEHLLLRLEEEIKLRKYSRQTTRAYVSTVKRFLNSGKGPREYLLTVSEMSHSTVRGTYFALKFFYENVLGRGFDETIPLVGKKAKLPVVLNKSEIEDMLGGTNNLKHKLILMFLYYAGLRLDEARNLKWQDLDFERELIHIKVAKGERERVVFLHRKVKGCGSLRYQERRLCVPGKKRGKVQQEKHPAYCQKGSRKGRNKEECYTSHTPAQLCHPSSGGGR